MPATAEDLKARARAQLPPQVASSVERAIDADASRRDSENRRRAAAAPPSARPEAWPEARVESVFTGFLGDTFYGELSHGRITGRPTVQWNGADTFMFIEDRATPFTYKTAAGRVIQPRSMATDGGSIPRLLHVLQSFSPWGYGPAYIIHDWLFTAHRGNLAPDNDWAFEESATVLAECIKSLMEIGFVAADMRTMKLTKDADAVYLIYQAVRTPIAQDYWNTP